MSLTYLKKGATPLNQHQFPSTVQHDLSFGSSSSTTTARNHRFSGTATTSSTSSNVRMPFSSSSPSNVKNSTKLWDRIIMGLGLSLVFVIAGFVVFFTYNHRRINEDQKSYARARSELLKRMAKDGDDAPSNRFTHENLDNLHNNQQQHNGNDGAHEKVDEHQQQQLHSSSVSSATDGLNDKDGELLVDAGKFSVIAKPSEAEHDGFWKLTCVGGKSSPPSPRPLKPEDDNSKQNNKKNENEPSSSLGNKKKITPCIFNLEFFDRKDLHSRHENHDEDANFKKIRKVGDGIKRKYRPIPDDALVEENLHERKLSVWGHANNKDADPQTDFLAVEAPDSFAGTSVLVERTTSSFFWVLEKSNVKIEMTSDLNSNYNSNNHNNNNNNQQQQQHQKSSSSSKEHTSTFKFHGADKVKFFGLGNRGSSMELPNDEQPIRLKNLDINHYQLDSHISLYGTVPLLYAAIELPNDEQTYQESDNKTIHHHRGGRGARRLHKRVIYVGIFYLNGATMSVTQNNKVQDRKNAVDRSISFKSEGGGVRVFFLPGPSPTSILRQYYQLTGTPHFPPLFALGYHQCRWTYKDQADILQIHKSFNDKKLPLDVLWLDIDHTNGLRYFTWDTSKFPDPEAMQYKLFDESGRRMVTITDPHIKHDSSYHVFSQGSSGNHFVTHHDGRTFYGHCWPGQSAWIDFLKEDTRSWYASLFRYGSYRGSTPYLWTWNDMNEPSVFSGPDLTLPMDDVAHFGGEVSHRDVHNVYGFYQSMATFSGLYERDLHVDAPIPLRRPFALTRSFFAGTHRYAAVWTGDNQGKWEHLKGSFDMTLMLSVSGIPLVGADVGGFFDSTEHHLLASWYSAAVAYPFFRGHSHQETQRREPYLIRDQGDRITRALRLRYRVIPYLYTCFSRLHFFGEPVMRPLFFLRGLGDRASFVFGGDEHGGTQNSHAADFNANSAEYFFWGSALMWRPFVDEKELRNLHANPHVEICSGGDDKSDPRNLLWMTESAFALPEMHDGTDHDKNYHALPNFVSWCSMQWINPFRQPNTCKIYPTSCETPIFQRSETIVVTVAHPSLRYDVHSYDSDASSSTSSAVVSSIPYPRSTEDLLPKLMNGKKFHAEDLRQNTNTNNNNKNENKKDSSQVGLEVRVAFSLDMDIREGDILANGNHFIDSTGENEISARAEASSSSNSNNNNNHVKYCTLSWSLVVAGSRGDQLKLCASVTPQDYEHDLPQPNLDVCYAEMRRLRRAVFAVHVDPDKKRNKEGIAFIDKLKNGKIVVDHGDSHNVANGAASLVSEKIVSLMKKQENPESWVIELPLIGENAGVEEGFQELNAMRHEWCMILE